MEESRSNFIRNMIDADLRSGKYSGRVVTRFPPEPNGYLHIGHVKAVCVNFGLSKTYQGGVTHLRFDDTNPTTEDIEFVESIQKDIKWLGFDWGDKLFYASDYFQELYDFAIDLIERGKAYVCDLTEEEIREYRGTVKEPGKPSPGRERSVDENLDLFRRMRAGEFEDGACVLRARIDMANPNMKMRDPLLYRIRKAHHYRTGNDWPIYPMYDYAHCLSDALERITHSICTLEFENNRELYDWIVAEVGFEEPPEQTEMARLNVDYTITSKRKLLQLVTDNHVSGWDDPRMPTVAGMRRRGYPASALVQFIDMVGLSKANSTVDVGKLEYCVRDVLNQEAPRVMAVLDPLKVVITNVEEGAVEQLDASLYPHDIPLEGSRKVPFTRTIFIDKSDFMEEPVKGFFRLSPGGKVRLRYAYIISCDEVIKDDSGEVIELRCSLIPSSRSGSDTSGIKVKGTIQWVSASHGISANIRLYDRLFSTALPGEGKDNFLEDLNPNSLVEKKDGWVEPAVMQMDAQTRYQFTRTGYFWQDPIDSSGKQPVFNQIVGLRNSWEKATQAPQVTSQQSPAPEKKASTQVQKERVFSDETESDIARYVGLGVSRKDSETLATTPLASKLFLEAIDSGAPAQTLANWTCNEVLRLAKEREGQELQLTGRGLGDLILLMEAGTLSTKLGKEVLEILVDDGGEPKAIVEERGLSQISDPATLTPLLQGVLDANPGQLTAYRDGKTKLFGFFVGKAMAASGGKANPGLTQKLLRELLDGDEAG